MIVTMSDSCTRRVFFAARPDTSTRTALEQARARLGIDPKTTERLRWLDSDSWHITLRFIGNVEPAQVGALSQCVRVIEPFAIALNAIEPFPSVQRPAVLAATGTAEQAGYTLVGELEQQCRALGLAPETRPWRPHMTLARVRGRRELQELHAPLDVVMPVQAFVLMESIAGPAGNRYVPVTDA